MEKDYDGQLEYAAIHKGFFIIIVQNIPPNIICFSYILLCNTSHHACGVESSILGISHGHGQVKTNISLLRE